MWIFYPFFTFIPNYTHILTLTPSRSAEDCNVEKKLSDETLEPGRNRSDIIHPLDKTL
jgi:hypothetical protein